MIKEPDHRFVEATAKRCGVGKRSVLRWSKQRETQHTGHKPVSKIDMEGRDVEPYPDAYQYERTERLGVSRRGIGNALKRLGISRKKTFSHPKTEVAKQDRFLEQIEAHQSANRKIISIDERGFANEMPRQPGYAPLGARSVGQHYWLVRSRTNVIGVFGSWVCSP